VGGLFEVIDPVVGVAQQVGLFLGEGGVRAFHGADFPVERVHEGQAPCDGGLDGHVHAFHVVVEPLEVGVLPALGGVFHGHDTGHGQTPQGVVMVAPGTGWTLQRHERASMGAVPPG
jgi:hypothetical protein